jgi:hypothetical protein
MIVKTLWTTKKISESNDEEFLDYARAHAGHIGQRLVRMIEKMKRERQEGSVEK